MKTTRTKTAVFDQYHMFGTQSGHGLRFLYRGKTVINLRGPVSESSEFLSAAIKVAASLGFTHWRRLDGMGGKRAIVKQGANHAPHV